MAIQDRYFGDWNRESMSRPRVQDIADLYKAANQYLREHPGNVSSGPQEWVQVDGVRAALGWVLGIEDKPEVPGAGAPR